MMTDRPQQLRVHHLKLRNWRNFTSVDVPLARRAFIVGPNASGKSNFLDALRFLHDIARPRGGLQNAVEERGGISIIRSSEARNPPTVVIGVEVGPDESVTWRYEVHLTAERRTNVAVVTQEFVVAIAADGIEEYRWEKRYSERERPEQTGLEQTLANQHFQELHEFLSTIRYRHLVPQLVREVVAPTNPGTEDPYGRSLLVQMGESQERIRSARLRRISAAMRTAIPGLRELRWELDEKSRTPHIVAHFEHWRGSDARRDERSLSDGTLRLVGVLWDLLDTKSVLLLEEPELSLHERLVERLPGLFATVERHRSSGRPLQTIVSTHSGRMFDDAGVGLDEVLLVEPDSDRTRSDIRVAASIEDIVSLVGSAGVPLADVVRARTSPTGSGQLALDLGA